MSDNERDENNTEKTEDKYLDEVFELYKDKSKTFQLTLAILIGFALFFFFTTFLPYFSIQFEKFSISQNITLTKKDIVKTMHDINNTRSNINNTRNVIGNITNLQKGIMHVKGSISNGPDELRRFISRYPIQSSQAASIDSIECNDKKGTIMRISKDYNHRVTLQTAAQIDGYKNILNNEVIKPLNSSPVKSLNVVNTSLLNEQLSKLPSVFEEKVKANPCFYLYYKGEASKLATFGQFNEEIDKIWNNSASKFQSQSDKLKTDNITLTNNLRDFNKTLNDKKNYNGTLFNKLKNLTSQETQLSSQWKEIESPFGKFPIRLTELVALFPVAIGVGILIYSYLFCELLKLRKEFHCLSRNKYPNKNFADNRHIALVAPLWIDPINSEQSHALRFIILIVPFIIFIASIVVLLYTWVIIADVTFPAFPAANYLNQMIFGGLYIISLGFSIYSYWHIIKKLNHY
jgi:hypothetical protein